MNSVGELDLELVLELELAELDLEAKFMAMAAERGLWTLFPSLLLLLPSCYIHLAAANLLLRYCCS